MKVVVQEDIDGKYQHIVFQREFGEYLGVALPTLFETKEKELGAIKQACLAIVDLIDLRGEKDEKRTGS